MQSLKTIEYPFIETYLSFMDPDLTCMICGYYDTKAVFHPLRKVVVKTTYTPVKSGVATDLVDIAFPRPGTRHDDILRCPMCLAKYECSLGNKIWNLL